MDPVTEWDALRRLLYKRADATITYLATLNAIEGHLQTLRDAYAAGAPQNRLAVPALHPKLAALLNDPDGEVVKSFRAMAERTDSVASGLEAEAMWRRYGT